MFSFLMKKKTSPEESNDEVPIPGARVELDDGSFHINNKVGNLYPSFGQGTNILTSSGSPIVPPRRPAPSVPPLPAQKEMPFNYLQGVPFKLAKQLTRLNQKDNFNAQMSEMIRFATGKMHLEEINYDFSVERSVLRECS